MAGGAVVGEAPSLTRDSESPLKSALEISSVTDAEFKTLVIRMFKVTLSEIKVYRGPTVEWMKPRIKSMIGT